MISNKNTNIQNSNTPASSSTAAKQVIGEKGVPLAESASALSSSSVKCMNMPVVGGGPFQRPVFQDISNQFGDNLDRLKHSNSPHRTRIIGMSESEITSINSSLNPSSERSSIRPSEFNYGQSFLSATLSSNSSFNNSISNSNPNSISNSNLNSISNSNSNNRSTNSFTSNLNNNLNTNLINNRSSNSSFNSNSNSNLNNNLINNHSATSSLNSNNLINNHSTTSSLNSNSNSNLNNSNNNHSTTSSLNNLNNNLNHNLNNNLNNNNHSTTSSLNNLNNNLNHNSRSTIISPGGRESTSEVGKSKRPRKARSIFSADQLKLLNDEFERHNYINNYTREELASKAGITPEQVKIWFQNMRSKRRKSFERAPHFHVGFDFATLQNYGGISSNNGQQHGQFPMHFIRGQPPPSCFADPSLLTNNLGPSMSTSTSNSNSNPNSSSTTNPHSHLTSNPNSNGLNGHSNSGGYSGRIANSGTSSSSYSFGQRPTATIGHVNSGNNGHVNINAANQPSVYWDSGVNIRNQHQQQHKMTKSNQPSFNNNTYNNNYQLKDTRESNGNKSSTTFIAPGFASSLYNAKLNNDSKSTSEDINNNNKGVFIMNNRSTANLVNDNASMINKPYATSTPQHRNNNFYNNNNSSSFNGAANKQHKIYTPKNQVNNTQQQQQQHSNVSSSNNMRPPTNQ